MSGIRVRPGLKGRAGYTAGVLAIDSNVKLLTNFAGNQDDNALSRKVGITDPDAVRLRMAPSVSAEVRVQVMAVAKGIASGLINGAEAYTRPELATPV